MPFYQLRAQNPVPPNAASIIMLWHHGDKAAMKQWIASENVLTRGARYQVLGPLTEQVMLQLAQQTQRPGVVLALQVISPNPLDQQAVRAGQQTPHNTGNNRPAGEVNSAGFQDLGDEALAIEDQAIYGGDIRVTHDIVNSPNGPIEQPQE